MSRRSLTPLVRFNDVADECAYQAALTRLAELGRPINDSNELRILFNAGMMQGIEAAATAMKGITAEVAVNER